jgi:prepilin-type N-terminal cleavage/methylation domain-containing protein
MKAAAFSLVEVLCAILILGVALAGLAEGISTALTSHKESELQTTAALLAAGQIEELRAEGWLTDETTEGEWTGGLSAYRYRQTVAPTVLEGLHDVTVVIEHTGTGKPIYELRTLLFEAPTSLTEDKEGAGKEDRSRRRRGAG